MLQILSLETLPGLVGKPLGPSEWVTVTQERINQFAEATGDHQWIHVDVARAAKESPFGGTIAHGYLTLSLVAKFSQETIAIGNVKMGVNYGLNRVRFTSPVRAASSGVWRWRQTKSFSSSASIATLEILS